MCAAWRQEPDKDQYSFVWRQITFDKWFDAMQKNGSKCHYETLTRPSTAFKFSKKKRDSVASMPLKQNIIDALYLAAPFILIQFDFCLI